jgi:hypothetical protein
MVASDRDGVPRYVLPHREDHAHHEEEMRFRGGCKSVLDNGAHLFRFKFRSGYAKPRPSIIKCVVECVKMEIHEKAVK